MKEIKLQKIGFASFIKLTASAGLGLGVIFGVMFFILSLPNNDNVSFTYGTTVIRGFKAGIINLFAAPILFPIIFAWFALFLYLGLQLYLKIAKQITIKVQIESEKTAKKEAI